VRAIKIVVDLREHVLFIQQQVTGIVGVGILA
jgi:hypothetical protein